MTQKHWMWKLRVTIRVSRCDSLVWLLFCFFDVTSIFKWYNHHLDSFPASIAATSSGLGPCSTMTFSAFGWFRWLIKLISKTPKFLEGDQKIRKKIACFPSVCISHVDTKQAKGWNQKTWLSLASFSTVLSTIFSTYLVQSTTDGYPKSYTATNSKSCKSIEAICSFCHTKYLHSCQLKIKCEDWSLWLYYQGRIQISWNCMAETRRIQLFRFLSEENTLP